MKIIGMTVPSGAFFGRLSGLHQLRDDPAAGRFGDPQIAIFEERPQSFADPGRVAGLHMREGIDDGLVEHGRRLPT